MIRGPTEAKHCGRVGVNSLAKCMMLSYDVNIAIVELC